MTSPDPEPHTHSHSGDDAREAVIAVVREVFARVSAGDLDGMMALMGDDLQFELAYAPDFLPPVWDRKTFDAIQRGTFGRFSRFALELGEVHPALDPGTLIAEYRSDAEVAGTGKPYRNSYIGVFKVSDGQVRFWREFHNTEVATAAFAEG